MLCNLKHSSFLRCCLHCCCGFCLQMSQR